MNPPVCWNAGLLPVIGLLFLSSCQVQPYAPPPQRALVDSLVVEVSNFHGRPEASALIKGRLTTNAAQLVEAKQSRAGDILYIDVMEQTPRGGALITDLTELPPYQTRVPLELLGLEPGTYLVSANGIEAPMEVPPLRAETSTLAAHPPEPDEGGSQEIALVEEFIASEVAGRAHLPEN